MKSRLASKSMNRFFMEVAKSQAAYASSYLNGLDVVVNYDYDPVARPVDVVSRSVGQSDKADLAGVEFSSLGVCSRAGPSRLELLLFDWLAGRPISPYGSCTNGVGVRNIPIPV